MATNGWYNTAFACFSPQASKIVEIFHMGLGWEVWAQIEMGVQCKRESDRNNATGATSLSNFEREKTVYKGSQKRCDFLTSYIQPQWGLMLHHFVELKCLRKNQTISDFAKVVGVDIDKIINAVPLDEWARHADYVGGWAMAITVSAISDHEVEIEMLKLARSKGITWDGPGGRGIPLADVGYERIIIWTWTKTFINTPKSQQALASYHGQ